MRPLATALVAFSVLVVSPRSSRADDDADLGRIPGEALKDEGPPQETPDKAKAAKSPQTLQRKLFLEDAFTASPFIRPVPVPYPKNLFADYQNRTSLDGTLNWSPLTPFHFVLSDRLSVLEESDYSFSSARTVENDLREAFISAEFREGTFLEAGRVNVRSGIALGFNPTDFLKTRTLVDQSSLDPSVIRENRLGTLMVRLESIFEVGAASLAFAPKVKTSPPLSERHPSGLDLRFGATNGMNRALGTLSLHLLDLSPTLIGYLEPGRQKVGLDVSHPVGSAIVAYGEWAGGREANLPTRAHDFAVATGTLPSSSPVLPPTTTMAAFRNDVATGFSLTVASAATLNFEYHFHEGGLGRSDLRRWFSTGSRPGTPSGIPNELWFIRGYASDQGEPFARHQLFVRTDFPRTLRHNLDLSAFTFLNLEDASSLSQLSFSCYPSDSVTVSGFLSANLGNHHSEHGSYPDAVSATLALRLYL